MRNSSVYDLNRVTVPTLSDTTSSQLATTPSATTTTTATVSQHYNYVLTYGYNAEKEPIQFPESWRTRRDKTEYDGNVAIYFRESESPSEVINIPYFVCLGNKKEFYPRPHMLSNVSSLKRRQRVPSTREAMQLNDIDIAGINLFIFIFLGYLSNDSIHKISF